MDCYFQHDIYLVCRPFTDLPNVLNEVDTNKSGGSLWVGEGEGKEGRGWGRGRRGRGGGGREDRGGYPSFNELR